jgi:hypothetical protein
MIRRADSDSKAWAEAGRVALPRSFPAAWEDSGKNFFLSSPHIEKLRAIKELSTKFGNNRKPGREAKKTSDRACDRLVIAIITIDAPISN